LNVWETQRAVFCLFAKSSAVEDAGGETDTGTTGSRCVGMCGADAADKQQQQQQNFRREHRVDAPGDLHFGRK